MKLYYYLFYKIYSVARRISDDSINRWKPLIAISVLEIFFLFQLLIWFTVLTKKVITISNPLMLFIPIGLGITIANYYIFLHNNNWKKNIAEFKGYTKNKKRSYNFFAFLIFFLIGSGLIFAFYNLSKINWQ